MKKFFINISLFILPLAVGWWLLEKKLQTVPNSYNQKKKYLEAKMAAVEVINTGSSHALNGIDPQYFSHPGFNLANITQTIYYDEAMVREYIDKMPKLKLVIIPVSYFTLHRRLQDLEEDWRMYLYYYYWHIPVPGKPIIDINKYSLMTIYTPHVTMGIIRRGFKVDMAPKYTELGFEGKDSVGHIAAITDESGKAREQYHAKGYNPANVAEGTATLAQLLELLKAKHITAVMVTTPVYRTFSSNANPQILATIAHATDSLSKAFGCRYVNYFTDPRFGIDDFTDNDHLNYMGAAKFSKILDSEVVRPALSK